ncbi:MAG: M48 family metallopeptidase [Candidatus Dojkabacteria bacterium]|nr:M48 family metallopeptidase [Candidatus Dojkabacteria bacterium]
MCEYDIVFNNNLVTLLNTQDLSKIMFFDEIYTIEIVQSIFVYKDSYYFDDKKKNILILIQNEKYLEIYLSQVFRKILTNIIKLKVDNIINETSLPRYNTVRVKDQISIWGSCSKKGNINLNWRIGLLPIPISRYVIIHELCHLIEFNHSSSFWKLVSQFDKNYILHRKWIKINGIKIMQLFRF